jgi:hypothetical protein
MAADDAVFLTECEPRYVFTIEATADSERVGQTPEGQRLDLQYQPTKADAIKTKEKPFIRDWWDPLKASGANAALEAELDSFLKGAGGAAATPFEKIVRFRKIDPTGDAVPQAAKDAFKRLQAGDLFPLEWFGFDGAVISGSDWVLLRGDLVAEFSGRFTLRSDDYDHGLIDAVFTGVVDYAKDRALKSGMFSREGETVPTLPLLLSATFNAAGAAQSWAPSRIITQATGFWKYQRLTQGQFIAVGKATVGTNSTLDSITKIELDVFELRHRP